MEGGLTMALCLITLLFTIFTLFKLLLQWKNQSCCYMLAYQCYKPIDPTRKLNTDSCVKIVLRNKNLGLDEYRFLLKTIVSSGIGEHTYAPKNVLEGHEENPTLNEAVAEMDDIIFDTLDKLFAKTLVSPSDIKILVVSVSLFSPSPCLTSRIVNRYKMREDIKAFNLSGMGCSASIVAIDLVNNLFKCYDNSYAIVVATESMGPNWYVGKEKQMVLSNCLFRSGGCSMLFTNKRELKHQAMLKLNCLVRTHLGANDEAYQCCIQVEDDSGYRGFRLTKNLPKAASKIFAMNLRVLVPKILPWRELFRYVIANSFIRKNKLPKGAMGAKGGLRQGPIIGLNLKTGVDHFCIHPGGRAVIDSVGKSLGLNAYDLEPARMALHRFGNTSSAGFWYVFGYMEAKKRLKKGERILMISFGAGFKCNNCAWEVVRDLEDENVWKDCIDSYPPQCLTNPFMEKYSWIYDESLNFIRNKDFNFIKNN
ncbi:3-ketoacyl-CoA synthase 19-like isoform X1 [Cucumis melo]|uniref:3-ketoacyl-CoA synthase n=1 Tax=Cucumis melo TaxID=3656 RepID=A0A1S3CF09_CUCME|nr:3-ketoacyl-CoA synthase 19-like isoform X1 [Cucumis melo]